MKAAMVRVKILWDYPTKYGRIYVPASSPDYCQKNPEKESPHVWSQARARYILNKRWSLKYSALPQKPRKKGRGKTGQTMMSPSFYSPLLFIKETCSSYPNLILDQV